MRKILMGLILFCCSAVVSAQTSADLSRQIVTFPEPQTNGQFSLEQVIANRRSVRQFSTIPLYINQIGQMCFAAQGITDKQTGHRAAPSAGGIYPMQLHVVLPGGVYLYEPATHSLAKTLDSDVRPMLYVASFKQKFIKDCPCIFVISGSARKVEVKYRGRGEKFTAIEAGHIAQNIQLQAVSLGLASVPAGGFEPKSTAKICRLADGYEPLYLIGVGRPLTEPNLVPAIVSAAVSSAAEKTADNLRSKKVVIVVPKKYFSDQQYYGVEEAMLIAGIVPDIASSVTGEIKGQERSVINSTILTGSLKADDYDAFVFIGGPGAREYLQDSRLIGLVRSANNKGKVIAAIEIAPQLFANAGIVRGKRVSSAVSQRTNLIKAGADWQNTGVEIDGNMVTANETQAARRFGIAVLNLLRTQQ